MTFEEFLRKKKIDPVQLREADPAWFSEFNSQYDQMGEKSFDHSKKFLFNKLRREYHLKEEPKPIAEPLPKQKVSTPVSPAVPASGAYVPRFKPGISVGKSEEEVSSEIKQETPAVKPAYKPRFRAPASVDKDQVPAEEINEKKQDSLVEDEHKPAYKPRFSAKTVQQPALDAEEQDKEDYTPIEQAAKPAYKPRFRPGVTPPAKEE